MLSIRIPNIDSRKIPGVVFDKQRLLQTPSPGAQDVIPVTNLMKVNAISLDYPRRGRQEVLKKLFGTYGNPQRLLAPGHAILPRAQRRLSQCRMYREMVNAGDLQRQPTLKLGQSQGRSAPGIVSRLLLHIGVRRAGKQMSRAHHGSDEPFDVPSKMRLRRRAVLQRDAIFLTAAYQRLRMKFLPVVDMNHAWQSAHGPFQILELPIRQPTGFWQNSVREYQRDRQRRGRF